MEDKEKLDEIREKLEILLKENDEIKQIHLSISYGFPGNGRGNTEVHIKLPYTYRPYKGY